MTAYVQCRHHASPAPHRISLAETDQDAQRPSSRIVPSPLVHIHLKFLLRDPLLIPETMFTVSFHVWLGIALFAGAIRFLSYRYTYGLRRFNGPLLASFTNIWKLLYFWRNQEIPLRNLHDHYGDVMRIGPNTLSFRNPQAIRDIFGAGKNWAKVSIFIDRREAQPEY